MSLRGGSSSRNALDVNVNNYDTGQKQISLDEATRLCMPPLSNESYKGSSGRIGVLGGSAQYTGAPYYAAMSALKTGCDLAFVFCAEEAAVPIKCYSPELMVAPVYNAKAFDEQSGMESSSAEEEERKEILIDEMVSRVTAYIPRMHCLIVGPGLGRCPLVMEAASRIIRAAIEQNLSIVIDADGLYMLSLTKYNNILDGMSDADCDTKRNVSKVVLTPNVVEFERLRKAFVVSNDGIDIEDKIAVAGMNDLESEITSFRNTSLQHCAIIKKGFQDRIFVANDSVSNIHRRVMICEEEGGQKRSGGIGDVLAGATAAFVAWNTILDKDAAIANDLLLSCWYACCATKRATKRAFMRRKRAMTAPDILEEIGMVVDEMTSSY